MLAAWESSDLSRRRQEEEKRSKRRLNENEWKRVACDRLLVSSDEVSDTAQPTLSSPRPFFSHHAALNVCWPNGDDEDDDEMRSEKGRLVGKKKYLKKVRLIYGRDVTRRPRGAPLRGRKEISDCSPQPVSNPFLMPDLCRSVKVRSLRAIKACANKAFQ